MSEWTIKGTSFYDNELRITQDRGEVAGEDAGEVNDVKFLRGIADGAKRSGRWHVADRLLQIAGTYEDLLAACEAAVKATGGSSNWKGETHDFLKLCEAAILKAKGTPPESVREGE